MHGRVFLAFELTARKVFFGVRAHNIFKCVIGQLCMNDLYVNMVSICVCLFHVCHVYIVYLCIYLTGSHAQNRCLEFM